MGFLKKRKLVVLIAMIAAVAVAGGAYAATQSNRKSGPQAFLNDVAKRLGVTPAKLNAAVKGAYADRLSAAVAAGRLTKAQANAIEQRMNKAGALPFGALALAMPGSLMAPGLIHSKWGMAAPYPPAPPYPPGPPYPPPYPPGPPGQAVKPGAPAPGGIVPGIAFFGLGPWFGMGHGIHAAVKYLGISPAKLLAELRSGKTLAQVARSHGKTAAGLTAAIVAAEKARLDKLVTSKRLTRPQEAKLLTALQALVAARIHAGVLRLPRGIPPAALGRARGKWKHAMWQAYGPPAPPATMGKAPPAPGNG